MMNRTITVQNESEQLVAEQALLAFRATKKAAALAEHGRGLEMAEEAALTQGREVLRVMLEQTLAAQAGAGKGGQTPSGAAAPAGRGSSGSARSS